MAYITGQNERSRQKDVVMHCVAGPKKLLRYDRDTWLVEGLRIHVRFCSGQPKFNINPNTLRSAYELWICGSENHWYLIPIAVVRQMYEHPKAYPDRTHPGIRVVNVDPSIHRATFAAPCISRDLQPFYRGCL